MSLNKLLSDSQSDFNAQLTKAKSLAGKWEKTGLLEGLAEREKYGIAVLLENQAKELILEANQTGTAEGSEEWAGVALPLVRRVFAEIAAKDFVSVQPMNLPAGLVFYLDFKYATAQAGFTTGAGKDSQLDTIHGLTETSGDPTEGLYGAGRFGYTINDVTSSTLSWNATLATSAQFTTGAVAATTYNYDTEWSSSYAGQFNNAVDTIKTLTVSASALPGGDAEGVRAFEVSGSNIKGYFSQFTALSSDRKQVTFVVSGSGAVSGVVVSFHKQPGQNLTSTNRLVVDRGDFEEGNAQATLDIPSLDVQLRSETIAAKTRKLKAQWTPEFSQDLNAFHAIDAEAELTSIISEYISQEIDLEILDMLIGGALTTERWSAKVGRIYDAAQDDFVDISTSQAYASAYNQSEWFQTLGTKIKKVSNKIHQKTMRGGANFMVVSPDVATILESMPGYSVNASENAMQFAMGVQKVGTVSNMITVYKNPYFTDNLILLGFRGSQFLETGAVYAPYIPLIMTPLVYDPTNFTPRKAVMTRYAKKLVRPEFYGLIKVADVGFV